MRGHSFPFSYHPNRKPPTMNPPTQSSCLLPRLTFTLLLAACPAFGLAQEVAPVSVPAEPAVTLPTFSVSTTTDKGYRAGNSVSATRIDTPIKDLPFAVSAFTEQFIEDIGARELKDIVRFAPSVTNNSREFNAGNSKFAVRGFEANPLRNGFPGTGYIDAATVQRVEIVKGPASLLYGQIQAGGVINYVTKRPTEKQSASLSLQYGSYDFYRAQLDVSQPLVKDKLLARFNYVYENDFEYVTNHQGTTRVLAPVVTWKIAKNTTLTLDYQWFERRDHAQAFLMPQIQVPLNNRTLYPSTTGGVRFPYAYFGPAIDIGDDRFNVSESNDFRNSDYNTFYTELAHKISDHWNGRMIFTYDKGYIETRQHGRGDVDMIIPAADLAGLSSDPAIYLNQMQSIATIARYGSVTTLTRRLQYQQSKNWNRNWQAEVVGRYDFSWGSWKPLFGYTYNNFASTNFTNTLNTSLTWKILDPSTWVESNIPNSSIPASTPGVGGGYNHGVYAVQPFSLLQDRLQIIAGARWSKGFANPTAAVPAGFTITRTTPQIGIGYKLRHDLMAYANYSESFQATNRLLRLNSNTGTIPAKPYIGSGYEVGLKSDFFGGRLSATLAAFNIVQDNAIIAIIQIQGSGVTLATDLQEGVTIENKGLELEMVYSPTDHWQVYLSASYNDPRYSSIAVGSEYLLNTQPEYTAKRMASLWTRYNFSGESLKGLWLGGGFFYTADKTFTANNPYVFFPDRLVWESVAGYDWKWKRHPMSAQLAWKNMTDENDAPSGRSRGLPSRFSLSVTARY